MFRSYSRSDVVGERGGQRVLVHLHGVVDDKVRGHQGVDAGRVAAQGRHRVAHRGEVHHGRHAREILEDDARRQERDLRLGSRTGTPGGEGAHLVLGDHVAPRVAEHVLEQHLDHHGDLVQTGHAGPVEPEDRQVAVTDAEPGARGEGIGSRQQLPWVRPPGPRAVGGAVSAPGGCARPGSIDGISHPEYTLPP